MFLLRLFRQIVPKNVSFAPNFVSNSMKLLFHIVKTLYICSTMVNGDYGQKNKNLRDETLIIHLFDVIVCGYG